MKITIKLNPQLTFFFSWMVFWKVKMLHYRNTGIVVLLAIDQKFDSLFRSGFRWKQEPCFEWSSIKREGMQKQESVSSSEKHIVNLQKTSISF